jgi:GH24 family phage-related lysozyme (muramidase)
MNDTPHRQPYKASARLITLLKRYEGCRLEAYRCAAGVWTIGFGTTSGVVEGMKITQEQAEILLRSDLERFEHGVSKMLRVNVTQNQFDALVSLAYNIGLSALSKSTLMRKLNAGDVQGASIEFGRWNKAGGRELLGLTRRREEERKLFMA